MVLSIKTRARVVDLVASLAALVGPREVCDGNDEEAIVTQLVHISYNNVRGATYLFELSAIPASALYHAAKAANNPNAPPATIHPS